LFTFLRQLQVIQTCPWILIGYFILMYLRIMKKIRKTYLILPRPLILIGHFDNFKGEKNYFMLTVGIELETYCL
jgi:hypothetical protein